MIIRMYDPVIISYGKGRLPAYLADPDSHTDIVSNTYSSNLRKFDKNLLTYKCINTYRFQ